MLHSRPTPRREQYAAEWKAAPEPGGVSLEVRLKCLFINCQQCAVPFTAGSNTVCAFRANEACTLEPTEAEAARGARGVRKILAASGCSEQEGEQRRAPATSEHLLKPPSSAGAHSRRARLEAGANEPLCTANPVQHQSLVSARLRLMRYQRSARNSERTHGSSDCHSKPTACKVICKTAPDAPRRRAYGTGGLTQEQATSLQLQPATLS